MIHVSAAWEFLPRQPALELSIQKVDEFLNVIAKSDECLSDEPLIDLQWTRA